MEEMRFKK